MLDALAQPGAIAIPAFDKAIDELLPKPGWRTVASPVDVVIFEGELESLRRFKENVDEVRNGTECGIGVKAYNDVQPGDQIECFERIEVQRTL